MGKTNSHVRPRLPNNPSYWSPMPRVHMLAEVNISRPGSEKMR